MHLYNKLVRDRIPERILAKGEACEFHIATEEEYREKVREKLSEEVQEYLASESPDELADVLEVIEALGNVHGESFEELLERKRVRAHERGAFTKRIILEKS